MSDGKRKRKSEDEEEVDPVDSKKTKKQKKAKKSKKDKKKKSKKPEIEDENAVDSKSKYSASNCPPISDFRVAEETIAILAKRGITTLFPVQYTTFNDVYDGNDMIIKALTGSGKTLAFGLPIMERLNAQALITPLRRGALPKVICLAPTRELALQIYKEFQSTGRKLRGVCIYGGVSYRKQTDPLRNGVEYVIGTPGRIKDLIEQNLLQLSEIEYIVLDEADQMLQIGFQDEVELILSSAPPKDKRQMLLCSATVPSWIKQLSAKYLKPGFKTADLVGPDAFQTPKTVRHYAIVCPATVRQGTLASVVQRYGSGGRTIVFTNTKAEANELALSSSIANECQVLHGDIAQAQREITLKQFREGSFGCLVATDVASRGLDIPEVDLIVQCQPPQDVETYVHRSGRTGRAGRKGTCVTFFTPTDVRRGSMKRVERQTGVTFKRIGTPQPEDLLKVAAKRLDVRLAEVHEDMVPRFRSYAEKILEDMTPEEALARAMALATGYTQPFKQKSLLGSTEGYTTIMVSNPGRQLYSVVHVLNLIQRFARDQVPVKEISLCADGESACADIPSEEAEYLIESSKGAEGITFSIVETLPDLKEKDQRSGGYGRNRYGGGRYGGGRNSGGYGGNSNGYSRNNRGYSGGNRRNSGGYSGGYSGGNRRNSGGFRGGSRGGGYRGSRGGSRGGGYRGGSRNDRKW